MSRPFTVPKLRYASLEGGYLAESRAYWEASIAKWATMERDAAKQGLAGMRIRTRSSRMAAMRSLQVIQRAMASHIQRL